MNTEWTKTFLEIVKYGSINLAADSMFLSQSTVSTRLNLLEEELGYQLIQRSKGHRFITLTKEGQAFLPLAKRLSEIQQEAFDIRNSPQISLRIAAIDSFNHSFLNHLYQKLFSVSPEAQLMITSRRSEEIYTLLEKQDIDIGFSSIERNRKNIKVKPLFFQRFYVIKQCDTPSGIKKIHPTDLDPQKEILFHQESQVLQWHDYWWGFLPKIKIDSFSLLTDFLSMPGYWAIVPYSTIQTLPSINAFQIYELSDAPPDRICYLLEQKAGNPPKNSELLYQLLDELLNDHDFMQKYGFIRCP